MRRASLVCGLLLLSFALPAIAAAAAAPLECPLSANPPQNADELWGELRDGNRVFVGGDVQYGALGALRRATANRQSPPVAILSCVDSRVMPEVTFDRTIGELFVARVAGNTIGDIDLAGLEFAVANGWTNVIVVMGHSDCGAIKAALATTDPPTPALRALVTELRKGIGDLRTDKPTAAELKAATLRNVRFVASQLVERSPLLRACVGTTPRRLTIIPAYYDGWSGEVVRLDQPELVGDDDKPAPAGTNMSTTPSLSGARHGITIKITCRDCEGKITPLWDAWNNCVEEDYTKERTFKGDERISLGVTTKCPFEESRMHWRVRMTNTPLDYHADVELHVDVFGNAHAECGEYTPFSCGYYKGLLLVGY